MSAYIVDNDTINRLLAFLEFGALSSRENGYAARTFMGSPAVTAEDATGSDYKRLGQRIYALNVSAVSQRYPGENIETLPGPIETGYRYAPAYCPTPVQAYKTLKCLLYQCSEGDVPERPLYQALVDLKHGIAESIACNLPGYDEADWG